MDKLDPSTKKQLNLLLAKTSGTVKQPKPIVSTVPIAQIRKAMLKPNDETVSTGTPTRSTSPSRTSPTKTPSRLSPSKSNYELSSTPTIKPFKSKILSPSKSSYDFSPSKLAALKQSVFTDSSDVPMDKISIPLNSPTKTVLKFEEDSIGSPMKIDAGDFKVESEDEEIILNVPNVIKTTLKTAEEVEILTEKIKFYSPLKKNLPHSISSPSISSRIKSLGLAAGTPLRVIYQNSSNPDIEHHQSQITKNHIWNNSNNSLLTDLIEEFCNTRDEECFKKILALTSTRTGDFDGLTSNLVHKLFNSSVGNVNFDFNMKLLTNFLKNESFLLSLSGKEVIEILEENFRMNPDNLEITKNISKSNLVTILIENCIEMCCERLSEFKLILLAEFIKNFIGANLKEILTKSITPLLLVIKRLF